MANDKKAAQFYDNLQSVAKLIGDLALNVADAQDRLDTSYVRNLKAFLEAIREATADLPDSETRAKLILSLAPSRYQFTETVIEARADMQMSSAEQFGLSLDAGFRNPVLAVAVNASYVKRSAYDYRAAALIRSVLHAVPADPAVMEKLIEAARTAGGATLPQGSRYTELAEAFKALPALEGVERPQFSDVEEREPDDELHRIGEAPEVVDPDDEEVEQPGGN